MPSRKVKRISVPEIQRNGRAVALMVECEDGETIPLLVNVDDLRSVISSLLDGLNAAEVTEAVRTDDDKGGEEELRPAPIVYHADGVGFVREPPGGLEYILVSTAKGDYICIGFEPYRLRNLLDQIEDIQSIQTPPQDDAPPN